MWQQEQKTFRFRWKALGMTGTFPVSAEYGISGLRMFLLQSTLEMPSLWKSYHIISLWVTSNLSIQQGGKKVLVYFKMTLKENSHANVTSLMTARPSPKVQTVLIILLFWCLWIWHKSPAKTVNSIDLWLVSINYKTNACLVSHISDKNLGKSEQYISFKK